MKKKDLIFYAGAAVLMAVSAQGVSADELVSNEATTTEGNQVQAEKAPEVAVAEKSVAPVASNYAAPANVTEPAVTPVSKAAASESGTPSVEKATEASTTEKEETPLPSDSGSTTFFNTGAHAPAGRSTDVAVQPKSFVDVSSHNGDISIGDYRTLANKGVGGVVVKLTEDTWYKNPNAENQIRNAQAAGLQVSTYHFSRYTSEEAARAEARFYIAEAQRLSLPKNTLMVNDFEDAKMQPNINRNTQAWADEMRKNGYTNLMFYTSASWLDENNLRKKGPVNTAQFGLQNFWVAQYPSPKLSVNDAKSLRYNGKAGAWQFTSQAELLPGKHLFDHSVDYTGRFTANAKPAADPTEGSLSGKIDIVNNDTMTGRFDVVISNVKAPNGVRTVSVPIWSETGGQDDLVWYTANRQANGTYTINVKAADHKNSTGLYNVHLYYVQNNGQMTGVGGTTTTVAIGKKNQTPVSADLTIAKSEKDGTFTITAKNLQGFDGYKEVKIPFWSHANGMKDIIWYTPTRQADGSYTVTAKASNHENADGKYEAQVFYVDAQGQNKFVKKAFIDYTATKPANAVAADLTITKSEKDGTFTITAKNLQGFDGYKEVKIPFWSHVNGMKDIIWYTPTRQADGSYTVTAKASDHENADGKYEAQVFYVDAKGQNKFVKKAFIDYTASKPSADLTITKSEKDGTFTITAKNLQGFDGYKEVKIPFWSHANGMKDIIWYTPTRQADGSYTVTAKASDHENADGKYEAQVFYVDAQGQNKFVKKAFIDYKNQSRPTGTLLIQNNNKDTGTFDVIIKDVYSPKGVQTVQVPTWSDKDGQDDIRWYEATRQSNGDYKVSVKASDHKNSTGKYHVHLYYIQNDGSRIGIGTTTTDVEVRNAMTKTQASIKNVNATNGTYTVAVDQAPQGRQIKNIRVAAWSKAHQENLYWYSATPTGMHTEITVSANNHGNEAGNYTTHVYVDYKDGGVEGFNLGQTSLSPRNQKVNPQTTYYSQRDPRWAGKYYGVSNVDQSGCVPTSLAMTFTDILGRTVLPTTVADYLYNNTDSFNKGEAGTDSDGIVAATRNWGLKSQLINGAGGIAEALMAGKHVLAAVGNSQFTSDPYTHELVLHGYDNGRTYVRDPYNSGNNGWYSINYLHSIKSKDPMDNKLGAPFFSIFV
ncbi:MULTISPECIES: GBS Bsp-like repeat-containing protein [unclassified Streptococcus]|uniref:GBS Bsp-like repeat-containing protein n=1 Tax=unclassified Streptococcus TaxID=2608887 RepID=UPI0020C8FA1A|nr:MULTISPECIES: GBS Bsp-like repeat-containing protein [unclassified Streptococcus]MCP8962688.1 GBS Bsp-like repeat-containing protein [Streptococcus sp. CF8_St5-12]MCP8980629.1 GBS Bsp-like repeat-containing protein [Streptococcus sp. CF8_St5-16]MCP8983660.1 GBS Bsp-like repeat-containing protein [Streptococcus sp. CF8_St5-13]MCP9039434.1 GBS Bsp-like repeat-containing protein [Streptococcus sp. CF8_St5-11]